MKIFACGEVPDSIVSEVISALTSRGFEVFQSAAKAVADSVPCVYPLSKTIELLRSRHGLSVADIASLCCVTDQTIYNWMRCQDSGAQGRRARILRKVLRACECTPGAAAQVRSVAKSRRSKVRTGARFRVGKKLADREKFLIRSLRKDGIPMSSIAVLAGVSESSVRVALREEVSNVA